MWYHYLRHVFLFDFYTFLYNLFVYVVSGQMVAIEIQDLSKRMKVGFII
jgi:hypothetical protein